MVRLSDLAMAAFVYDSLSGFNSSLARLMSATDGRVELDDDRHRGLLLEWLNDWGCRHLAKGHHSMASAAILAWYEGNSELIPEDRGLGELSGDELEGAAEAYRTLKDMAAALQTRSGRSWTVSIGPTAATKILYALRPRTLMPWDEAIRRGLGCDGSAESYIQFLWVGKELMQEAAIQCGKMDIDIADLPAELSQPDWTMMEVVNKYLWVKHTRKCEMPSPGVLARWAEMGQVLG